MYLFLFLLRVQLPCFYSTQMPFRSAVILLRLCFYCVVALGVPVLYYRCYKQCYAHHDLHSDQQVFTHTFYSVHGNRCAI